MRILLTAASVIITLAQGVPAIAEGLADGAATKDYEAAMSTMMTNMMVPYSGNADVDFVTGMIPHHQGAVDMARIVLKHGSDPEVRKFAEGVIAAQEAEIAWMREWLAKQPK
jgi:uncharacterized protein (DUF305 family)